VTVQSKVARTLFPRTNNHSPVSSHKTTTKIAMKAHQIKSTTRRGLLATLGINLVLAAGLTLKLPASAAKITLLGNPAQSP
jgi:hypothetical protein